MALADGSGSPRGAPTEATAAAPGDGVLTLRPDTVLGSGGEARRG